MLEPLDPRQIAHWLRELGAQPLAGAPGAATIDPNARRVVLVGLLVQATGGPVDARRVEAFVEVGRRVGLTDDEVSAIVEEELGITLTRLQAYGVLGLPLGAGAHEIKRVHRALVKRLHPDRLVAADDEARLLASRRLGDVNAARAMLVRGDGVVVSGGDDLTLDEPSFEPEDAPTVVWGEHTRADAVDPDAETVVYGEGMDAELEPDPSVDLEQRSEQP